MFQTVVGAMAIKLLIGQVEIAGIGRREVGNIAQVHDLFDQLFRRFRVQCQQLVDPLLVPPPPLYLPLTEEVGSTIPCEPGTS